MFCSPYSSYLYTPEFLELTLHIASIISIPCHILAFYCVLFKTPQSMESVRMTMLTICIWNVILDLQLTILSTPFVMFPAVAGYPIGYLSDLGVSTVVQTVITVFVLGGCLTSLSCLFENRYTRIAMKNSKYHQIYIYAFNMTLLSIVIYVALSDVPEQSTAVSNVFEKLPCIPPDIQSRPIFVISLNKTLIGFCIGFLIFAINFEYFYFVLATLYHFKVNLQISNRTRNLQKSFFFSIVLQIFIPVFIIFTPWTYAIYSCFFDYYNQAFNNLLTLDCGLHGTVSSISMLLIHKPYREAMLSKGEKRSWTLGEKIAKNTLFMNCSTFFSNWDSPEFVETVFHVTSIVSIPCHILAFYCVIFKTPRAMESVKMAMLSLCIWTVILDIQITLMSSPFVVYPVFGGFPLGYLNYLELSTPVQTVITVVAMMGCLTAISCLFANRYSRITSKGSNYQQLYIYGFNLLLTIISLSFCMLSIPDQISARQLLYEKIPCLSSEIRSHPIFVFTFNAYLLGVCIGFTIFCILFEYLYYFIATTCHLKYRCNTQISSRTRNLQQTFLFALAIQICIPLCILLIPWIYAVYSSFFDYYNQTLNNLTTLDCGLHGIVSSITMILIHKPYRDTVLCMKSEKIKNQKF